MPASKTILKIGAAVVRDRRILLVRKRGTATFILPGGKPEGDETDLEALGREIREELGCGIAPGASYVGEFRDVSADGSGREVAVRLWEAELDGDFAPLSEIEEAAWYGRGDAGRIPVAPSLANRILPHLVAAGSIDA